MNDAQANEMLLKAQQAEPSGEIADQLWQVKHERAGQGYSQLPYADGRHYTVTKLDIDLHDEWMRHRY